MVRQAIISGGVAYHYGLIQPGQPFAGFEVLDVGDLAGVDLNRYDLVVVPRSTDGEALRARRYQFARFLDQGGVLLAFGELWADWFPGCRWEEECVEDTWEPVMTAPEHPIVAGFSVTELHWHPARERWCCHGHLVAPPGSEVLVRNARGDAWLYVDRVSTNGVIVAASNLDPDTHTFHGSAVARRFLDNLLDWARAEAAASRSRRGNRPHKIAGLYSGVHFQRAFYDDPEFAPAFAVLPVWELEAANLDDYAALWVPRESNQTLLTRHREKIAAYLQTGGTLVCFDEVNQPWLPVGTWRLERPNLDTLILADHPLVAGLTVDDVRWHSHGSYARHPNAQVLVEDSDGAVLLFLDERTFPGAVLAGTMDPDCHAGFGTETTRPLLRAILGWLERREQPAPAEEATAALRRRRRDGDGR